MSYYGRCLTMQAVCISSIRHGLAADQGPRKYMEDAAIAHSSLSITLADLRTTELPDIVPDVTALYAVSVTLQDKVNHGPGVLSQCSNLSGIGLCPSLHMVEPWYCISTYFLCCAGL